MLADRNTQIVWRILSLELSIMTISMEDGFQTSNRNNIIESANGWFIEVGLNRKWTINDRLQSLNKLWLVTSLLSAIVTPTGELETPG